MGLDEDRVSDVAFVITFQLPNFMLFWICVELLILECRFFSDLVSFFLQKFFLACFISLSLSTAEMFLVKCSLSPGLILL